MGIRFLCPNGHKLNVKTFQAGRRGICPFCGAKFQIPTESTIQTGQPSKAEGTPVATAAPVESADGDGLSEFEETLEAHLQHAEVVASSEPPPPAAWAAPASDTEGTEQAAAASEGMGSPQSPTAQTIEEPDPQVDADHETPTDAQPADKQPAPAATTSILPVQPDPLAELPSAVWYVRPPSGGQFGPAQADMMRGWLTEGRVSPETLVWREGWADWKEASSVFPQLQPATTTVPEAPPVATTNGDANTSYRPGSRRSNGPNVGLIAVLIAAVLILLLVLIYILSGGARESSSERDNSVAASVARCRASETFPIAC